MDRRKWGLAAVLLCSLLHVCRGLAADTPPNTAAHGAMSIGNFIRPPDFSKVTISPDGRYLAGLVPEPSSPYENLISTVNAKTAKVVARTISRFVARY